VKLVVLGGALAVAGLIGAIWSSTELTNGLAEIPAHWWSSLATAPLFVGIVLVALGLRRARA
jgi:hypothetical protein